VKRIALILSALLVAGLAPMLMAPTGGYPFFPQFGGVGVGTSAPTAGLQVNTNGIGVNVTPPPTPAIAVQASGGTALTLNQSPSLYAEVINGTSSAGTSQGIAVLAGTNNTDVNSLFSNGLNTVQYMKIWGDGGVTVGPSSVADKGAGSVNAQSYFINGTAFTQGTQVTSVHLVSAQTYTSTTTLAAISGLSITLPIGQYDMHLHLLPSAGTVTNGIKWATTNAGTATVTLRPGICATDLNAVPAVLYVANSTSNANVSTTNYQDVIDCRYEMEVTGAGTYIPEAAQNTSSATGTVILAQSFVSATPIT
jgi:hypothetical protein